MKNNTVNHQFIYKKLETEDEILGAKNLIIEYLEWLNQDLSFQNIEDELNGFPEKYKEPEGSFIIAKENENVIGCVGIRNIGNKICEMKRLFVNKNYKGLGIGKKLVGKIIDDAVIKNYEIMRLDTLNTMEAALDIYFKNGFYVIEPYYNNPYNNVIYLEKKL